MKKKLFPDFSEEQKLWHQGIEIVIGVDEVGRGSFAGPVVAATVCFTRGGPARRRDHPLGLDIELWGIDDSKQLTPLKRQRLAKLISAYAFWGIGEAGVSFINKHGIVKATEKAMRAAIADLQSRSSKLRTTNYELRTFVLIDAFHVKYVPGVGLKNQRGIIKGDQKSISIAAASIIAKVHRDKIMTKLHKRYPKYYWKENKGYGTAKHIEAISKYGLTKLHRRGFIHLNKK